MREKKLTLKLKMQKKYQKILIKTIYTKTAFTLDDCAKILMETCEIKKKKTYFRLIFFYLLLHVFFKD